MAPTLSRLIDLWTCPNCNGEGKVTSSSCRVFPALGTMERITEQRDCNQCGGSGVKHGAVEVFNGF